MHKKKTLYTFSGKWDKQLNGKDLRDKKEEVFWDPHGDMAVSGLKMIVRPLEGQEPFESRRLWHKVSLGLLANDQTVATDEKCIIEDAQRKAVREREEKGESYEPRFFKKDDKNQWTYKWFNLEKWGKKECEELEEVEEGGIITNREKV